MERDGNPVANLPYIVDPQDVTRADVMLADFSAVTIICCLVHVKSTARAAVSQQ